MAESISLFAIVVGIALLLSGIGFGILAAGGTLSGGEPALRLFGKRTPKGVAPQPFLRRSTSRRTVGGAPSRGPTAFWAASAVKACVARLPECAGMSLELSAP